MFSFLVHVAEAQDGSTLQTFMDKLYKALINPLITLLFVVALVLFLAGLVRFLTQRDQDSEEAKKGRQHMLWGVIGMFIMISVFGIMRVIINTIGSGVSV